MNCKGEIFVLDGGKREGGTKPKCDTRRETCKLMCEVGRLTSEQV